MLIIFADQPPSEKTGAYVPYDHQKCEETSWEYWDVRKHISDQHEAWYDAICQWHRQVSNVALELDKDWWFFPGSRVLSWYPPAFEPFFFSLAVLEMMKGSNASTLCLLRCPEEVQQYIKEMAPEINVDVTASAAESEIIVSKVEKTSGTLKKVLSWVKPVYRLKSLVKLTWKAWQNDSIEVPKESNFAIISYLLNSKILKKSGDHFFRKMFDNPSTKNSFLWVYFSNEKVKEEQELKQYMDERQEAFVILQKLLHRKDIVKVWKATLKSALTLFMLKRRLPSIQVGNYQSQLLSQNVFSTWIDILPALEFSFYYAVKHLLQNSQIKALIYPYEEKGLERAIVRACREQNPPVRSIGFAHAVHSTGHLYMRDPSFHGMDSLKPDILATTGDASKRWLNQQFRIPTARMVVTGSNRHGTPLDLQPSQRPADPLRILVVIGHAYELRILANYIDECPSIFDDCEVVVRKYPFGWHDLQDAAIRRINKNADKVRVEDDPLQQQLEWSEVVLFSSTSAGIEAMSYGRYAVYTALHNFFPVNPVENKGHSTTVPQCTSSKKLKDTLDGIKAWTLDEWEERIQEQIEFAKNIYSPIQHETIEQLCQPNESARSA